MGTPFQSLMNCNGCISLYFYDVGYWDPRYGSPPRDKNSIRHFRKSKGKTQLAITRYTNVTVRI